MPQALVLAVHKFKTIALKLYLVVYIKKVSQVQYLLDSKIVNSASPSVSHAPQTRL